MYGDLPCQATATMLPLVPVRKAAAGVDKRKRCSRMSQQCLCHMGCESVSSILLAEAGRWVITNCGVWGPGAGKRSTGGQWITALELFREMRQCQFVGGMVRIGAQACSFRWFRSGQESPDSINTRAIRPKHFRARRTRNNCAILRH